MALDQSSDEDFISLLGLDTGIKLNPLNFSSDTVRRRLVSCKRNSKRKCYEECTPVSTTFYSKTCTPSTSNTETVIEHSLSGRRIVNISHFINCIQNLNNHGPLQCSFSNMKIMSEVRKGLNSGIKMKCEMCHFQETLWAEDPECKKMPVNTAAVSGIMKIGGGVANLEEFLSTLDIPPLSSNTYQKEHDNIATAWEKVAENEMYCAAMEEKHLAVQAGEVGGDGIPMLTVVVDGCWAKRSYRTNYSSLSGAAAIVGFRTKKVLYMAVRNRYCMVCSRAAAVNKLPGKHCCSKNWHGSSSSMEANIIQEGFQNSVAMYGVKYAKVIGDGDSNVYKTILDSRPYDELQVEKLECQNHLFRNFCLKLKDIVRDSKAGPITLRKCLGKNILRLRKSVISATAQLTKNEVNFDCCSILQKHILNAPYHVFGDHQNCVDSVCSIQRKNDTNWIPDLLQSGLLYRIMNVVNNLADNSKSLLFSANNNCVEQFHSIVAKFIGGKRVNFCLRRSYLARCSGAVISHNSGSFMSRVHKSMYNTSPGNFVKSTERRRENDLIRRKRKMSRPRCRKSLFLEKGRNKNYSVRAEKPDLSEDIFSQKKERLLSTLQLSIEERKSIERKTVEQRKSFLWREERRKRLTASDFA
ncbi:yqaJ domain-containing protein [Nephila pilipes]|uniref:YqaJ domain-containing protein n=1 Tax=Nephila pilipes TaxID=299642 RepID=A0A8X6MIJ2_NEPPI|nr:yqaJ domain-containing protein [Nephila pilipes]